MYFNKTTFNVIAFGMCSNMYARVTFLRELRRCSGRTMATYRSNEMATSVNTDAATVA